MKEIKKYTDVIRYGKSSTKDVLKIGDYIIITEKIDGANASFRLDETNPLGVSCYSRNTPLDENNRLRGFYDWVLNNIVPIKDKLEQDAIYYGEWCCPHKIQYKPEAQYNFYLFSIWDIETESYIGDNLVRYQAEKLNIKTVPYFYEGEFISFEHMMSFVGKSDLTIEPNTGEGIVVKNVDYFDKYDKQCFVKLVSEKFAEVQKQKPPKNPNADKSTIIIKSVLTKARVEKLIHKLIDEGMLSEDFDISSMGIILKLLGNRVYEDIMKEESDLLSEFEESIIKRGIGKSLPLIVKEVLKEMGRM